MAHVFGDADEKEPSQPEMVAHINALARTDLEFPLGRHNLGIDARDIDASIKASTVVGLDDVTSIYAASPNAAVVRALRTGETSFRPAIRSAILPRSSAKCLKIDGHRRTDHVEESVLLFDTEPRTVLLGSIHGLLRMIATCAVRNILLHGPRNHIPEVCLVGRSIRVVCLGQDEHVAAITTVTL
jgi:hypothetical protein